MTLFHDLDRHGFAPQGEVFFWLAELVLAHRPRVGDRALPDAKAPFVLGIAGSVSVGKSTVAARLRDALLAELAASPVEVVSTDGFLFSNAVLEERGLMHRKGYPESYDLPRLVSFLVDVRNGVPVCAPRYCHHTYDVLDDEERPAAAHLIERPRVLILEGINVLQPTVNPESPHGLVSDFLDFSIYVDADPTVIEAWYVERFLGLIAAADEDPTSYFHRFADLDPERATELARSVWREVNLPNLEQHIAPTGDRARLILRKAADHSIESVLVRV